MNNLCNRQFSYLCPFVKYKSWHDRKNFYFYILCSTDKSNLNPDKYFEMSFI